MAAVVLYFHVHQPYRVKPYSIFAAGHDHDYFNTASVETDNSASLRLNNEVILKKVARNCYLPAVAVLNELMEKYPELKISFSISGAILDQFEQFLPEVLMRFKHLAAAGKTSVQKSKGKNSPKLHRNVSTNRVEFLAETYHHSLAFLYSKDEFRRQVKLHHQKINKLFGQSPTAFRNTELIYNNELAMEAEKLGYKVILAEGVDHILGWRSPNFVYRPVGCKKIKLLLKNYRLSDDIAFRFSDRSWSEWPLTADRFAHWVSQVNGSGQVVNLFMDFETLGEHQWAEHGIFEFLRHLPGEILKHPDNTFMTVTEAARSFPVMDEIDMPQLTSWADTERDLSAWLSNPMQHAAIQALYELEDLIIETRNPELITDWRRLQSSDHFYYMCTKWWTDGDVHKYFSPYDSPYDAFVNYMNVLHDLRSRVEKLSG
jgi:alpha-amylase